MRFSYCVQSGLKAAVVAAVLLFVASSAHALPFNTDMMDRQLVTGKVMRPKAPNTVAYGSLASRVETKEDAQKLENPLKADPLSAYNGERIFSANCSPCHGRWEGGAYMPSSLPVAIPSMDLTTQRYRDMTDGWIYMTIHFGSMSTLMPAHGWKFSPEEHWDLVNYIRKMQTEIKK